MVNKQILKILNSSNFTEKLLRWYPLHRRDLPWRASRDPYIIWLSEIILQQTRVAQGLPYFHAFVSRFPRIEDLAAAPEEEILRTWQGLGYYSRARNLHACAREIVRERGGKFPENYQSLLNLKGVGPYTAAAIASFAYKEPVAVVDGNVYRVLARYFGISADIASHAGKKEFQALADKLISSERPDEYNQAIMEFGALQCVPTNPDCGNCPLSPDCQAKNRELVGSLPHKEKKTKIRSRYFTYHHIQVAGHVVVRKRTANDIWQGLVDFPLEEFTSLEDIISPRPENLSVVRELAPLGPVFDQATEQPLKHLLSHQRIFASFVKISIPENRKSGLEKWAIENGFQLVDGQSLEDMGKPKLMVRYLNQIK
ncbi:A/G-specific adenine glycosylase [Cyclobacterium xiamenense]|uniref:A/G-specific adenine glycosylase n=1 Tax=Cyclobacterium xiamenense TaxID=1297121 RepID=UPI0035D0EC45